MIDSMEEDDAGAQFNRDDLVRISRGVGAALSISDRKIIMGNRHSDDKSSSQQRQGVRSRFGIVVAAPVRDAEKFLKSEVDNVQHQIDRVGRN